MGSERAAFWRVNQSNHGQDFLDLVADDFEKLNAKGGFTTIQFFSDHPNPANRSKAIDEEAMRLPQRSYGYQTGQFSRMKKEVAIIHEPPPKQPQIEAQQQ